MYGKGAGLGLFNKRKLKNVQEVIKVSSGMSMFSLFLALSQHMMCCVRVLGVKGRSAVLEQR